MEQHEMTITLITGGNKGLGFETARRLIGLGHTVYIGARDEIRGQRAAAELGAKFLLIDVTSDTAVTEAVARFAEAEGHLDLLINNAGVSGGRSKPEEVTAQQLREIFETNVFGVVRVTHAFLPLLRKAQSPAIINVSSGLGSFGLVTNPDTMESKVNSLAYCSSKAAVTMLTLQYAKGLPGIRVNAVDPGPTSTDLNGHLGRQSVQEGTDAIVRMATAGNNASTATFTDRRGAVPW
jgi:NAD(P)-dependent dehydrogenase (short-subunit alcohol dehydrogenase family)